MIEKIQNLIEDNTSMDVTRKQVIMGLTVLGLMVLFVIFMMTSSGGPSEDAATVKVLPLDATESYLP